MKLAWSTVFYVSGVSLPTSLWTSRASAGALPNLCILSSLWPHPSLFLSLVSLRLATQPCPLRWVSSAPHLPGVGAAHAHLCIPLRELGEHIGVHPAVSLIVLLGFLLAHGDLQSRGLILRVNRQHFLKVTFGGLKLVHKQLGFTPSVQAFLIGAVQSEGLEQRDAHSLGGMAVSLLT